MENDNIIVDNNEALLFKYLEGKADKEEADAVNTWQAQSPENKKILEDLFHLMRASDSLLIAESADADKSFESVKKKIRNNLFRRVILYTQRIAAVLFFPLLLASVFLWLNQSGKSIDNIIVKGNPGTVSRILLPDSSKVWLSSKSSVSYPNTFEKTRDIDVEGKVYIAVKKDMTRPFTVSIFDELAIEVLGTEFNIDTHRSDSTIEVTLIEGSINAMDKSNNKLLAKLNPGEQIVWNSTNHSFTIKTPKTKPITSWKDGMIVLDNTSLADVVSMLEDRFNARLVLENEEYINYRFTGTFINQQLEQILEHLKVSSNIDYEIKKPSNSAIQDSTIVILR